MSLFIAEEVEINRSGISMERLGGEVVIISFETGKYFNTNGPAADLLYLIEKGIPQVKWESILANAFQNFHLNLGGIEKFLKQAFDERIIITGASHSKTDINLPSDYKRNTWSAPQLSVFDDLADLLLVDPIHETSTEGWPKTKDE
jgi:hypothetical protein